jgi:transposase
MEVGQGPNWGCSAVRRRRKGNAAKKIHDDMSVTLGDTHPSYSTDKNWVAMFRTGHLNTEDEERSGRPTQVTIP